MPKYDYFVAHKFTEQEKNDLRVAIENAFKGKKLNPYYADNEVRESGTHILDKIIEKIRETDFGIFDITDGNSNVCLELGLAKGLGRTFFIICNKKSIDNIPSDLKGLDRIDYGSYKELTDIIKKMILPKVLEMPKIITTPKESVSLKEDENRLREHSKLLVDKNLRFRANTDIGFDDYNFKCDLHIQIKNLNPTTQESDMYSKNVDAHLESGYEKVWNIIKKTESLISQHDAKAQEFLVKLKSKITSELKKRIPNISEWNDGGQPPIKYFTEHILFEVGCILQLSYKQTIYKGNYDSFFKVEKAIDQWQTNRWQISANRILVASDNEEEIHEIKHMIIGILGDAINGEDFKVLKKYFEDIKNEHALFIMEINEIIKEVESGSLLNGHCSISICRNR